MNIEQFSKEHLSAVLDALIRVKNGEIDDDFFGICWNADHISTKVDEEFDAYRVVEVFSAGWPQHSGQSISPVPFKYGMGTKWSGRNGALRYELLDYLIDKLTKVIGECDD